MLRLRSLCAVASTFAVIGFVAPGSANAAAPAVQNPYYDAFYAQPASLASVPNGTVLQARPVSLYTSNQVALGLTAYQVKYRSQDSLGKPVADVTTVILPQRAAPGPVPVLSYQVAEDSLGLQCAPSYALRTGSTTVSGSEEFLMMLALAQGWVLSVPDYEGPNSQYTAGVQAGHAVLDGIRATERFAASGATSASKVGLWGYSGGGQATAWAGELQGSYAPELNLVGIAEGGVPSDIGATIARTDGTPLAGEELGSVIGLSRAYPSASLGPYLTDTGKTAVMKAAILCNADLLATFANANLDDYMSVPDSIDLPQFSAVLDAVAAGQNAPVAPVYAYHEVNDELIPVAQSDALQAWYCSQGVADYYVRIASGTHVQGLLGGANAALYWLSDRFAGKAPVSNCASTRSL